MMFRAVLPISVWPISVWMMFLITCVPALANEAATKSPGPANLRCEYRTDPLGISVTKPRLSWEMVDPRQGAKQTAYRILVASSSELLEQGKADLWDTGRVESSQNAHIVYDGKPLTSGQRCYWTVQLWDKDGEPANKLYDEIGCTTQRYPMWSMGLLKPEEQQVGKWIGLDTRGENEDPELMLQPPAYLRKEFPVRAKVKRATLYVSSRGLFEISINGYEAGLLDEFKPGWTNYDKRIYYMTYDVTHCVFGGIDTNNAISAIVAPGWYSGYVGFALLCGYDTPRAVYGEVPSLWAQLHLEYEDGTEEVIGTDETWKATTGPIRQADILMGEVYDARRRRSILGYERADGPGYDDSSWKPVEVFPCDVECLEGYPGNPVRELQEMSAEKITEPKPGVYVFDMGQNFAGKISFMVRGKRKPGQKITFRFAEMLHDDGMVMTENLRKARCTDTYICSGEPGEYEYFETTFTYHGFQYVEVTGLDGEPQLEDMEGHVLHSDTPFAGVVQCNDDRVNQLMSNIIWTQKANFFEVPTDCPQRDERLGWTGDAQVYVRSATYNMDVAAFFTKWLDALEDDQWPDGAFPDYAPTPYTHHKRFSPAWMDAGIICPYTIWQVYGDRRVIEKHYDAMARQVEFCKRNSKDFLRPADGNSWGDWLAVGTPTPKDMIATAYFALEAKLMAEMAAELGRDEDAAEYRELFKNVSNAYNKAYVTVGDEGVRIKGDTQTCYVIALSFDLLPEALREKAAARLVELIEANGNKMSTGFLGTKDILHVLSDYGYDDLAYRLLTNTEYPSWLYPVENGATSIWERWNSYTKDEGFANAGMNSFSHYSFGAVCEWMYARMAGIDLASPGYERILMRPTPGRYGVTSVEAGYHSIRGDIKAKWNIEDGVFTYEIVIPPSTTAEVHMPAPISHEVQEGVTALSNTVFEVPAGTYTFRCKWPKR